MWIAATTFWGFEFASGSLRSYASLCLVSWQKLLFVQHCSEKDDPRNHTKQHEMALVLFRVVSWIVPSLLVAAPSAHYESERRE
jgi:hypothetical protein